MLRAYRIGTRLLIPALLLAVAGCAKSKANETPAPVPATEAGAPLAIAPKTLLCSDGFHRRGDHWKIDCNVCRCGAGGDILCSQFVCGEDAGARDASSRD